MSAGASATAPVPPGAAGPGSRVPLVPTRAAVLALCTLALACAAALLAGAALAIVAPAVLALLGAGALWSIADTALALRAWRSKPLRIERDWPHAFALGVRRELVLWLVNEGARAVRVALFDEVDPSMDFEGLPREFRVPAGARLEVRYAVVPRRRGTVHFGATQIRLRSPGRAVELVRRVGAPRAIRVFPNFAAVARYAWLAGDRRLAQIGIKTFQARGSGTEFKQLAEYRPGDSIRHVDWKATARLSRPIVREYQDERDQRVLFLLDCGRRMRADEDRPGSGGSHFDQALNALMLVSYVALKDGDEVGAFTFGNRPGEERRFAPRKGLATLDALTSQLHDLEPCAEHSDYRLAAQELLRAMPRRALVIVLTNLRDEDSSEIGPALRLLRGRHLVLLANLRERVQREMAQGPLVRPHDAVRVAGAHAFGQARADAFARVVGADPLAIDVEPSELAVSLVNRYHAVKRARLL